MPDIQTHKRVNDILLGPLERPALQWLSARMPGWVNPDLLTVIGIIGAVMIFVAYWLSNRSADYLWLANLGLLVNWFGDSLDGTLARFRNIERPKFGFFIDHTVDAVSQVLVVLGLGLSPYVRFEVAALALVGYLLMSILVYVDTCVTGVFKISYGKVGPTEVRLLIILANTTIIAFGNPILALPFGTVAYFDLFVGILALLLFLLFVVTATRRGRELARLGE